MSMLSSDPEESAAIREIAEEIVRRDIAEWERQNAANLKFRAWLRRHNGTRLVFVAFLVLGAPYLFLSSVIRWLFSMGRFSADDLVPRGHPTYPFQD